MERTLSGDARRSVGIGGWLLLLIISLWLGAAVHTLVGITEAKSLIGRMNLGFAALAGVAAFLLSTKNPKGVTVAKIFLAVEAIYYSLTLGYNLLELVDSAIGDNIQLSEFIGFFVASIASVIYFAYLMGSQRVKNTYFRSASPTAAR